MARNSPYSLVVSDAIDRYLAPELTSDQRYELARRNYLLLQLGQAALGSIGPDILGLAVEPRCDAIVIHAALARQTPDVADDLQDIRDDLDAFLNGGPEANLLISTQIHVGPPDADWPGRTHALLYLAKPTVGWPASF